MPVDQDQDAFDRQVRASVYETIRMQGPIPSSATVAAALSCAPADVTAAFHRLAQAHVVAVQPERDELLMANPFSAVPTAFQVEAGGHTYWGNCVWDALGVLVMLQQDGQVVASCGDCNAAMTLTVRQGQLVDPPGVAHFSVPAKHWWDDIIFT